MKPALETLKLEFDGAVAIVTLNRPHRKNAFNRPMGQEFVKVWALLRDDPAVRAIVLTAEGPDFCTGVDTKDGGWLEEPSPFGKIDPGELLGPKSNHVWKPFIVAAHGMFAGGAFYWLNEADIVIGGEDVQFFDPHLTYGMVAALEPIGLIGRIGLGEILRMTLMANSERVVAETALRVGLISEIVPRDRLLARALDIARTIAAQSPVAVEGTLKAIWGALDIGRAAALRNALHFPMLGNALGRTQTAEAPPPSRNWTAR